MTEKQIKAFYKLMKDVHGMDESEVKRYLDDDTLLDEKITELKDAPTSSYKDGLADGTKKAKATIIKSLNKELEITIGDVEKIEKLGEIIKPLVSDKFKSEGANPAEESKVIKDLKKAHESEIAKITSEKDEEVTKAKSEAENTSRQIKMEAIARKLLSEDGYTIPADKGQAEMKFELAKSYLEAKKYKYEIDEKDNTFYRIGEDNVRVRGAGNKPLSYEDDLRQVYEVNYGKTPAKGKGASELPNNATGGSSQTAFDWSKYTNKTVNAPTTIAEGMSLMRSPHLELEDKKLIREFVEIEQAKEARAETE